MSIGLGKIFLNLLNPLVIKFKIFSSYNKIELFRFVTPKHQVPRPWCFYFLTNMQEELRQIIGRLKQPFAPIQHEIRELPGKGNWIFIPWQAIRERLDEVYPEWTVDYSEIKIIETQAFCKCGLTIAGIRKEAYGDVPVVVLSSSGKDISRGSFGDRVVAEAFKNAAEHWGVARYLDDQKFVISYLLDHADQLDNRVRNPLMSLAAAHKITAADKPRKEVVSQKPNLPEPTITEEQAKLLWNTARLNLKLSDNDVKAVLSSLNYAGTMAIPANQYEKVMDLLRTASFKKVL